MSRATEQTRLRASASATPYLKEILENEAAIATSRPGKRRKFQVVLLFALLTLALGLTAWNVQTMSSGPDPRAFPDEALSAQYTVYLIATSLEAYVDSAGTLPLTLEELNVDEEGVEYFRQRGGYELVAETADRRIIYRSGDDLSALARVVDQLERDPTP